MRKPKINDRALLRLIDKEGASQSETARALGVSRQAVSKRLQELRGKTTRVIAAKKIEQVVDRKLNSIAQLQDINEHASWLLKHVMKWVKGDEAAIQVLESSARMVNVGTREEPEMATEYKFKDPHEIALKAAQHNAASTPSKSPSSMTHLCAPGPTIKIRPTAIHDTAQVPFDQPVVIYSFGSLPMAHLLDPCTIWISSSTVPHALHTYTRRVTISGRPAAMIAGIRRICSTLANSVQPHSALTSAALNTCALHRTSTRSSGLILGRAGGVRC